MQLIIVESPTKAKTLSKFLGSGYDVEATMGHVKDLPKSKLGIDIDNNFEPDYLPVPKREATIKSLRIKAKSAKLIYIATDPDREGEAIAQHVEEILRDRDTKLQSSKKRSVTLSSGNSISRIVFHEITKEAVEEALKNPHHIDRNLVNAQIARRVLDRLVGYKLSPLLWKKVRRGLSAGRVQSVAVKLIIEKEKEIGKFKTEEYWEIWAKVKQVSQESKTRDTSATLDTRDTFLVQLVRVGDKKAEIKNKESADKILAELEKAAYSVSDVKKREVNKSPYPPFTTSTMQQAGARIFGWSSKKTMSIAQHLYEEGLITYHRTDSLNLSTSALEKARSFIRSQFGEKYLPDRPKFYKTKSKTAQEAHEAIRPTNIEMTNDKLQITNEGKRLYELIWKRFLACQMNPARYSETTIDVVAKSSTGSTSSTRTIGIKTPDTLGTPDTRGTFLLRASGQIMIFDGWRKMFPRDIETQILPEVVKDEKLELDKSLPEHPDSAKRAGRQVWGDQKFTQPPARYNEASLIKMLENLGIGRPSTYAPTISTIQIRNYVEKNDSKQFVPTNIGFAVNDFLITNFPEVFEYQFTAGMEAKLDEIANGSLNWSKEIKDFYLPFEKKIESVEKNAKRVKIEAEKLGKKCPTCREGELVIRTGRFGKFISCSRFPDCKHTEKYLEKVGVKCPECKEGEVIVKKTSKGRKFFGCTRYPDCKYASWKNPKASVTGTLVVEQKVN